MYFMSSLLVFRTNLVRGLGSNPQIGGKPDCGALFFCIFFPARQAVLLKFSALVSLFSGPEGLAVERRFPYLDNTETIGPLKNPCFWLCDAENWDF